MPLLHPRRRSPRGRSLFAVVLAALVLGLGAWAVIYVVQPWLSGQLHATAAADLADIQDGLDEHYQRHGRYPVTLSALTQVDEDQDQPILYDLPADPWGVPYLYRLEGDRGPYELRTNGADGEPGGEGENADVVVGG